MRTIIAVSYFWIMAFALAVIGAYSHIYFEIPLALVLAALATSLFVNRRTQ